MFSGKCLTESIERIHPIALKAVESQAPSILLTKNCQSGGKIQRFGFQYIFKINFIHVH